MPDPKALLAWYDRHRRRLPWRALPGEAPDAYRVWLSEIMLQQTTVKAVAPYYLKFLNSWPTVRKLAAAELGDVLKAWAGLGYYARARNLHACAQVVASEHRGKFPDSEEGLRALPGIGAYTAAAIAAIAFDRRAVAIDGNIERVIARLFAVEPPLPAAKSEIRRLADTLVPERRPGDFTQAMMDLGATICTPKRPACVLCPWLDACAARARGDQETFPRKAEKVEGKLRRGASFVVTRADGHVLVRSRPAEGLARRHDRGAVNRLVAGVRRSRGARRSAAEGGHGGGCQARSSTASRIFRCSSRSMSRACPRKPRRRTGMRWVPLADLHGEALPNVMRKVVAHAGLGAR